MLLKLRFSKHILERKIGLRSLSHGISPQSLRHDLLALMRETAQPVAVVTSLMPSKAGDDSLANLEGATDASRGSTIYHGATLSSFTSISMHPYPLIAFSLRIPSRMSDSLKTLSRESLDSHLVINILSAAQESVAVRFSRPDLHVEPFLSTPYSFTQEGLPIIKGALGALSCRLVSSSLPLHDLSLLEVGGVIDADVKGAETGSSELFIAQVTRVEKPLRASDQTNPDDEQALPLLYHRRLYTTVLPPIIKPSL